MACVRAQLKRYAYGLHMLLANYVGYLPSQRLRRFLFRRVFRMNIAPSAVIFQGCRVRGMSKITIGPHTSVGDRVTLDGRGGLRIGESVNISSEAMFWTAQHDYNDPSFRTRLAPITVGDYAWIGPRVIVLPGSDIAEGTILAAGAILRGATEPYSLYAGVPARKVRDREVDPDYRPSEGYTPFI